MPDSKPHSLLLTVLDDMGEFTNDLPRHRQGSYGGDLRTAKEQAVGLVEQLEARQQVIEHVWAWMQTTAAEEGSYFFALADEVQKFVVSNPAMCRHTNTIERPRYAIDDEPGHYLCLDCGDKFPLIGDTDQWKPKAWGPDHPSYDEMGQ